ncbi:MAG: tetratricopeptide repeat protein [Alphaproteobacteria bacterium]|nr:tetratricopeptide repeat protein [Alphaproteobacteria bacterium]
MKRLLILPVLLFTLLVASPAFSADLQKGWTAYESGDYATALREYTSLAKQGGRAAQYNLGMMYQKGKGTPQDYKTAVKWYRLAAEQRHVSAQINLGLMYHNGQGVIQDNVYAHVWWSIAASAGSKTASEYRDIVAGRILPARIEDAQKIARECVRKKYKGC